jgi:endonuclease-3 related protein
VSYKGIRQYTKIEDTLVKHMSIKPSTLYQILLDRFGHLNWWPMDETYHKNKGTDPRFEIIVGAILTQNTAWSNVEKALENLKNHHMLDLTKIARGTTDQLRELIRPSGFFNQKAERLILVSSYLSRRYHDDLDLFFQRPLEDIRRELLDLKGIGPETADSILLYAGNHPIFVVDAYTRRLCKRLPLNTEETYEGIQRFFEQDLQQHFQGNQRTNVYNELHALIVILAKQYCKTKPLCSSCPLFKQCRYPKSSTSACPSPFHRLPQQVYQEGK